MGEIRYPVVPLRRGLGWGALMLGFVALAIVAMAVDDWVVVVGVAPFMALFWGLGMWWFSKIAWERQLVRVSRISGPVTGDGERAFAKGLAFSGVLGVVLSVVGWATWALNGEVTTLLPGFFLGTALWVALEVRDLRRWQEETGYELFTRRAPGLVAWTSAQARERLVIVDQHPTGVVTDGVDP